MTWTLAAIRAGHGAAGGRFFERGAIRFFRSRILRTVYQGPGGVFFVTSEQFDDESPRLYTVRQFNPSTGDVDTFGAFNELGRAAAVTLARLCASRSEAPPPHMHIDFTCGCGLPAHPNNPASERPSFHIPDCRYWTKGRLLWLASHPGD